MQKNLQKHTRLNKFLIVNFVIFFLFIFNSSSIAEVQKNFEVIGNKSVNKETILSYLKIKKKNSYDLNDLNDFKKILYETNFFSKVDIEIIKRKIIITVKENPFVEYVYVDGVKNKDLLKNINKIISLKTNNFFSESFLKKDVINISSLLSSKGYFKNKVDYIVKKNSDNRLNIFYNIALNEKFRIKNIFFIGDKNFKTSTLSDVISSSRNSWLSFSSSSIPSKERADFDKSLLKLFYTERAYFDVQISDASIEILDDNYANLTFVINSGKKFKIIKINLGENSPPASFSDNDIKQLKEFIFKLENTYYNPKKLRKLSNSINKYMDINNLPVDVDIGLTKISSDALSLNINFTDDIDNNTINKIVIAGNDITEEKVIRNNISFVEGDRSAEYFYKESTDKLKSLGIFKNVKITTKPVSNSKNLDVKIDVEEQATGEIAAGAGFGTSGALLAFTLKEKNYFGQGILTDVTANLGTDKSLGNFRYSNPDFSDSGIALTSNFFITESSYDNSGYESKSIGMDSSLESGIFKNINLNAGFGIGFDSINAQENATSLIKKQDGDFLTTKAFYNVRNDHRGSKFETKSGYIFGFGQDLSSLLSDKPYLSNKIFGTFYHELHEDFNTSIKYKINSVNSLDGDDVKLSDRLFLSDNYLRGFKHRGYGPIHEDDHIGGNYSYAATLATTFPNTLPDKWGVKSNLFLDTGNLWGADLNSESDRNKFRSSVGAGLSWTSPLGPLSITYAQPITKDSSDRIEKFNFKIGTIF